MSETVHIKRIETTVYRAPLKSPVQTSFGKMFDRPMVLVRVIDHEGAEGWGEVWCNFPSVGAEHRARIVDQILSNLLLNQSFESPKAVYNHLTEKTSILALQSGEAGPFANAIAGLDLACHDLVARKMDIPLWKKLGGNSPKIQVYASGLNPTAPEALAAQRYQEGFRAFKLKIGFDAKQDIANLKAIQGVANDVELMADVNQAFNLEEAIAFVPQLEQFNLNWLEEPIRADRPWADWQALKDVASMPLAGGENIMGNENFNAAIQSNILSVIQPDVAKWGGLSACVPIGKNIVAAGRTYCPHYLGGGIGLVASAHAMAAVGGAGMLEIDANPNPMRTLLDGEFGKITNGEMTLTNAAGLGVIPDLNALSKYLVKH